MKGHSLRARVAFAAVGLREAYARERSFRTHIRFAGGALVAPVVLRPPVIWSALVGLTVALVPAFESLDSAREAFIELVRPDIPPEIKLVKDMAARAVLLLSPAALAVATALLCVMLPERLAQWGVAG